MKKFFKIICCIFIGAMAIFVLSAMVAGFIEAFTEKEGHLTTEPITESLTTESITEPLICEHSFVTAEKIESTWEKTGQTTYSCEKCSFSYTEEIKKICPVKIKSNWYEVDFLGGITLNFTFINNTSKDIKYIHFNISLYNAVGDIIENQLGVFDRYSIDYKITGPLKPEEQNTTSYIGFYNNDFKGDYKINKIQIDFMDGEVIQITENDYLLDELFID